MKNATAMIPFPVPAGKETSPPTPIDEITVIGDGDGIGEFDLETGETGPVEPTGLKSVAWRLWSARPVRRPGWLIVVLAVLAIAQVPIVVLWALKSRVDLPASTGTVVIDTEPTGIEVTVDGKAMGLSPLEIRLAPGQRVVELRHGDVVRSVALMVKGGETLRQRFEFVPSAPAVAGDATTGTLQITTDPSRVTVVVDGTARGLSPLSIADLAMGPHRLVVRFPAGAVEREVQVHAGTTASVQIAMPSMPGVASGWVAIDVSSPLRISEAGRFLGTTDIDRLMLPVGEHVLDINSDELGYGVQRTVRIAAGATATIQLELPHATLSINALPWAEAWVDGESVGETPIGNLSRTIGRHEVVLKHPELGERRESVIVSMKQPARVSVDLRKR